MKIIVAANRRMRKFASACIKSAHKLGYSVIVYDLGGLGFGKPFTVDNDTFQKKGYYRHIIGNRYSVGEHKLAVIKDCLYSCNEFIIYLDADTVLIDKIDEMIGDYDIGLTIRPQWEIEKVVKKTAPNSFIYEAYLNAGVMCFNPTKATYCFIENWEDKITELHNDQLAINSMLKEHFPLKSGQLIEMQGIKIRTFDTMIYNHYYFRWPKIYKRYSITENDIKVKWQNAKILHFKSPMRQEYFRMFHPFKFYFMRAVSKLHKIFSLGKDDKTRFSPW